MRNILLAFVLLLFLGCDDKSKEDSIEGLDEKTQNEITVQEEAVLTQNTNAPFSLNFFDGTVLSMKKTENGFDIDNGNVPIMFVFITTWCPPCMAQLSILNNINDKYKDYLQIVAVIVDDDKDNKEFEKFIANNQIQYKVITDSSSDNFIKALGGVSGVPYMALYNSKGDYQRTYSGLIPEEMLDVDIQKVIQ